MQTLVTRTSQTTTTVDRLLYSVSFLLSSWLAIMPGAINHIRGLVKNTAGTEKGILQFICLRNCTERTFCSETFKVFHNPLQLDQYYPISQIDEKAGMAT